MTEEKGLETIRQGTANQPGTTKPKYGCLEEVTVKVIDKNQPFYLGTLTLHSPDSPEADVSQLKAAILEAAVQICRMIDATTPEKESE